MTAATQHKTIKPLFTRHCPFTVTQPYCVCVCVFMCSNTMTDACVCVLSVSQQTKRIPPLCRNFTSSSCLALWFPPPPQCISRRRLLLRMEPPQRRVAAPRSPTKHSSNFQTDRLPTGLPSGRAHTGFRLSSLQASASKRTTVYEGRFGHMTWEYVEWNVSALTPSANTFTLNHKVAIWPLDVKKRWPMRSIKIKVWDTELQYGSTTLCLYYIIYYIFRWYFILYITFDKSCN